MVIESIQSLFPGFESQVVGTLLSVALLLLATEGVRRSGRRLKEIWSDPLVEAGQAALVTVLVTLATAYLVVIWRVTQEVRGLFELLNLVRTDVTTIILSVAIIVAAYSLTRGTKNAINRVAGKQTAISKHQREIAHHLVALSIYLIAAFIVFSLWNIQIQGLLVGAGIVTVLIGLAARQTLGAAIAGFVVLFSRPFETGDWVKIAGQEGVVTDITLVNTQIRTFDDEFVVVPNDQVTSTEIINRSQLGRLRLNTDVNVDYANDLERAKEAATEVLEGIDLIEEKPIPHTVMVEFSESSVVLRLRYYISNPSARKMWKARTQVITAVRERFADEGIKIPSPRRELSARTEEGGFHVSTGEPEDIKGVDPTDVRDETVNEGR